MEKYTLIITEKPDAARRIAFALDAKEKPQRMEKYGIPYYVARRDREIVIVPALGHLYTVTEERGIKRNYPTFNFKWAPSYLAGRSARQSRIWVEAISKLSRDADAFIDACDYDIEGSIIGYNILKYACAGKEPVAKRMKYSTLTKEEIEKAYAEPFPHLDFALVEAGLTRHEVDWLYGINLSRALTMAVKDWSGKYFTLSTGRVQGPTLRYIVTREKNIRSFVPMPYWKIRAKIEIDGQTFEVQYEKEIIKTKREATTILNACKRKNGQAKRIDVKQFQQAPPTPFDLGTLQSESYVLFGHTPKRTANIAQHLYLDALISYPRTSSQKLPPAIDYERILKSLNKAPQYRELAAELLARSELKPKEGIREDSAHPAIYPTGKLPDRVLSQYEKSIWDLIVRRFMTAFAEPATNQNIRITIGVNAHRFRLEGKRILKEGWLRFYKPYTRSEEIHLPPIKEGQLIAITKVVLDDRFTKPPPRYNPSSVLKKMEEAEIGTKATRADIIQTLYGRKYVKDERMAATDLGFEVIEILEEYCPTVISTEFTRQLETRMNNIQASNEKRAEVLADAIENLKPELEKLKKNQKTIGEQLSKAIEKSRKDERAIGTCPTCKTGKLVTLHSRKTGKRFIGCTNYFKGLCKTSFPLPQRGTIKPFRRSCNECGWPAVQVRMESRHSWILCLNPQCPSKKRRKKTEMQNMQ
jgi:DNA topoisomerase-1